MNDIEYEYNYELDEFTNDLLKSLQIDFEECLECEDIEEHENIIRLYEKRKDEIIHHSIYSKIDKMDLYGLSWRMFA